MTAPYIPVAQAMGTSDENELKEYWRYEIAKELLSAYSSVPHGFTSNTVTLQQRAEVAVKQADILIAELNRGKE